MPELPEVEHLRRSIDPVIVGARLTNASVQRRGVITLANGTPRTDAGYATALLVGVRVIATHRRGKQMAIEAHDGRVLIVQLGMTGSLTIERDQPPVGMDAKHRHVIWEMHPSGTSPATRWRFAFRDPRRFGGLTAYPSMSALRAAWSELGPDALDIDSTALATNLARTGRPIKAALLDQAVIAGVGNIYADESLFATGIHPLMPANRLAPDRLDPLAAAIRRILGAAVLAGGSTLRDYRDAFGQAGSATQIHQVYGRAGEPCNVCGAKLEGFRLQARATVFCPRCQHLSTSAASSKRVRRSSGKSSLRSARK